MTTPLFTTPHAPVGAWSSLTFGAPNRGLSIDTDRLAGQPNADLLITLTRDGGGVTSAFPFLENPAEYPAFRVLSPDALSRTLTPCVDEFTAQSLGLSLRLFTPHAALPNPKRSGNLQYATVPGILIELLIDNSESDAIISAFIGLNYKGGGGEGHLRPVDWSSKTLCGIGLGGRWILAATPVKDEVFTVQSTDLSAAIAAGQPLIEATANQGGILVKVPARTKRTLTLAFAFYAGGTATQSSTGTTGRYLYSAYFPRVEAVANFILQNHQKIRESCNSLDSRTSATCPDAHKLALFAQGIRAYEASTQIIDAEGVPYFTALSTGSQGCRGYRNAIDQAVDHLPWALYRNPWVIRNIFDLATTSYAYHDKVRFPSDTDSPTESPPLREGGMTFAHDFGIDSCYSPAGISGYEHPNRDGAGSFMSTEVLLDAVYLLTSYALLADDTPWAKTRLPFARELLTSMENRDHWDPERRTGILKAESDRTGTGSEVTAFVGAGGSLERARGNLYLAVKTFCANLMLTTYFQNNNDLHSADYSYAFAQKTAQSLVAAFNKELNILPANLLDNPNSSERLLAALEPLAIPTYLGLTSTLAEYFPDLFNALKSHAESCLKPAPEGCLAPDGSLRLSSSSDKPLPAKSISILYVLERLFAIDLHTQFPHAWQHLLTQSDPTDARLITAALYLKQ